MALSEYVLWYVPIIATIVYLGSTAVYNVYFHPLARFPGPKARAISEWPYFRAMINGADPQRILEMHNKYGPVVRVSPNELAFVRPEAFRDIYGYKKGGKPELSKDKKYFSGMGEPSLVKSPDPAYHAHLRRLLAPGFSDAALRKQEVVIQEYLTIFMSKLEGESQNGDGCVDVVLWFKFFVFDVIGYLTYGESFDCLSSNKLHTWVRLLGKLGRFLVYNQASERLPSILKYPFLLLKMPTDLKSNINTVESISQTKVDYRRTHESTIPDFMGKLIEEHKAGRLTTKQLSSNASFLMAAGSETLVTFFSHCVNSLLTNPRVLAKLTSEIREKFPSADGITMVSVNQCKYLRAVIDESMRVKPPAPAVHPRYTPAGGAEIDGFCVPGDVVVGVTIYAACNSPLNFHSPLDFVPERWTGEDPTYQNDARDAAQYFSVGPRDCLGRNLAYVEMKLVMAKLLWHFDLEQRFPDNWGDQRAYLVWEKPPMMVKLKPVQR
ncbi:putative P450 monooxygenase [Xylariaceae sp. AK1471]|nr:putative P450 monooxygenase [Xylariaceae sp. AK1471]